MIRQQPLRGPEFSSYSPNDVAWLLTDLSGHSLEAPVEQRERAIRCGAHYSESLPIEYQPTPTYLTVFDDALQRTAPRLAAAVATLATRIREQRGDNPTLVSLARAGTPVGILIRRYAASAWELDWPHYSISIIRDRGIDTAALQYIARLHPPASAVFVDGWTGKGAIARELDRSLRHSHAQDGFRPELAVLADPGRCAHLFGTREDFLIASACLNSTVSGLVSRTVLRPDLTGEGFHGAVHYRHLASHDRSHQFLDEVARHLPDARPDEPEGGADVDYAGLRAVAALGDAIGVDNLNLIKPGVGETTRVLLRRVPWMVLVDPDHEHHPDLEHIHALAAERGVSIVARPNLGYACIGVIAPGGEQEAA